MDEKVSEVKKVEKMKTNPVSGRERAVPSGLTKSHDMEIKPRPPIDGVEYKLAMGVAKMAVNCDNGNVTLTGKGLTALDINYWYQEYYPACVHYWNPSYVIEKNKHEAAFRAVKFLLEKGQLKITSVKEMIGAIDELARAI